MEHARVIIVEDDPRIRALFVENLEACDHTVVAQAGSVAAAKSMVDRLVEEGSGVDVAVVDGNLSRHSEGGDDGERVATYIHEKLGGVVVIGASFDGAVRGADVNVSKQDPWALYNKIAEL